MPLLCMIETINIGYMVGHTYSSSGTKIEQLWGVTRHPTQVNTPHPSFPIPPSTVGKSS